MTISIRLAKKSDLDHLLAADREWNSFTVEDADFQTVTLVNPWVITAEEIAAWANQRKQYFVMAVETDIKTDAKGCPRLIRWTSGGFVYEKTGEDGVLVRWFSLHPKSNPAEALTTIVAFLQDKTGGESITFHIRDRDEARIRLVIPVLQKLGFTIKLSPDHFEGGIDGWICTYAAQSPKKLVPKPPKAGGSATVS